MNEPEKLETKNVTAFVGLKTFDYSEAKRVLQRHHIHVSPLINGQKCQ